MAVFAHAFPCPHPHTLLSLTGLTASTTDTSRKATPTENLDVSKDQTIPEGKHTATSQRSPAGPKMSIVDGVQCLCSKDRRHPLAPTLTKEENLNRERELHGLVVMMIERLHLLSLMRLRGIKGLRVELLHFQWVAQRDKTTTMGGSHMPNPLAYIYIYCSEKENQGDRGPVKIFAARGMTERRKRDGCMGCGAEVAL